MTTDLTINYFETEHGQALIEECQAIVVEHEFASRWALVEGYHSLGERIVTDGEFQKYAKGNSDVCNTLAKNLNISERTLRYAIQFYEKYPDLSLLNAGKNISWSAIVRKYLPETVESKSKPITKQDLINMLKEIKSLLQRELDNELQSVNNGEIAINKSNVDYIRYLQDQFNKITLDILK